MIQSPEDLEMLLHRLGRSYERLADGTVLVRLGAQRSPVALRLAAPVLVAQAELGALPATPGPQTTLFRRALELNGSDLVHAAYAITGTTLVLSAALELMSLDPNELEAVLADFDMALSEHVPELSKLVRG